MPTKRVQSDTVSLPKTVSFYNLELYINLIISLTNKLHVTEITDSVHKFSRAYGSFK